MSVSPIGLPAVRPFVAADLLRLGAALSVVVGALEWGLVGFALFLLVLGGTMVPRAVGTPAVLDAAYCAFLLLGAWAAELDWYVAVGWLDLVVHAAVTGLVAAVGYGALVRAGALPARVPPAGIAVVTGCLGVTLAVLWELGEWWGHTWVDDRIQVGYADTVGDLAAGLAGAVLAGALVAVAAARRR